MLKVEHISSGYGKKQVLYDVTFEVYGGDVVLLTGGNGSGKSTLLKCIYNLLPIWTGSIWHDSELISGIKPSSLIRKGIVYIPQNKSYFENLSVEENLKIAGNIYEKDELNGRIESVYNLIGLRKHKKRRPFDLSGGEKKLLSLGMGLVHRPKLLLFDELFAGVDNKNSKIVLIIIEQYFKNESSSLIFVEHRDVLKGISSRNFLMEQGKIYM
jgi:ABC-type branched-subunit amino acid transport system ATPase component